MWNNVRVIQSSNENVAKYVFEKADAVVESVLYKYPTYQDRTVICCSTQSGCPVGCRFCGTGDYFVRSLTENEIISQPIRLLQDTKVNPLTIKSLQIMFMSMGEPLLNLKALIPSLHKLYALYRNARLLISTIGPRIDYTELMETSANIPTIGLQFSVHESTDEARDKLIPFKAKLSLQEIAKQGENFYNKTGRQPFFNYCVHEKNNTEQDANNLEKLLNPNIWQATISVICEQNENVAAANDRQKELAEQFRDKLRVRSFQTRVFDPAGQDTGSGCGQLFYIQRWMRDNPDKATPSIGKGMKKVHMPRVPLQLTN